MNPEFMASTTSNTDGIDENDTETSQRIKRRRLLDTENQDQSSSRRGGDRSINNIRWRSVTEQQTYSSKLIEALRHVRRRSSPPSTVTTRSRAVRETADKVLAVAAKGRTRWSRAILKNRIKMRLRNHHKKVRSPESKVAVAVAGGIAERNRRLRGSSSGGAMVGGGDKRRKLLPELEKRVQVLGQLVPGCRKLPFANLLEEATDYIAALEMQVRTMAALAGLLAARSAAGEGLIAEEESSSRLGLLGSHDDDHRR